MTLLTRKLTDKEKQEYIAHPYTCPYCGEDDISAHHFEPEGQYQVVDCRTCGREWREVFQLLAIEETVC